MEMTDLFGIGAAIRGLVDIYFKSARGTGRTKTLIEHIKDGDLVIFTNLREAERVRRLCELERGIKIKYIVINPKNPEQIFEKTYWYQGRIIFDHSWIEEFYKLEIDNIRLNIEILEKFRNVKNPRS
jgi:hypothetical protein